jgi:hypothetical protein
MTPGAGRQAALFCIHAQPDQDEDGKGKRMTWEIPGALGGTRSPSLLIRRLKS